MNTDDAISIVHVHPPLPLQCYYHPTTATPSHCTSTGRYCHLLCCIEFGPGIWFSQSLDYLYIFPSTSAVGPFSELPNSLPEPLLYPEPNLRRNSHILGANVTRTRHRMRNCQGESRGSLARPPPSLVSEYTSSLTLQFIGGLPKHP